MIEFLTKEQEARFPEFVKKWTEIGLSCEAVDLPRFTRGIEMAYAAVGLKPPEVIVCDSPLSAVLTATSMKDKGTVTNSVRNSVWNSVWNSVFNSVFNNLFCDTFYHQDSGGKEFSR